MSEILIQIDGKEVKAAAGATILEAAQSVGISIPTLCHHVKLEPYGGCRVCSVEIDSRGRTSVVAACLFPVEPDLVVRTRTKKLERIRKSLIEMMMAHAPDSEQLHALAQEYGADKNRFEKESSFCIHCGLCVRYCAEVKQANALGFIDRGARKEINFVPEIAAKECWDCKECFPLCPTSALQAAFVLCKSIAFEEHTAVKEKAQEPAESSCAASGCCGCTPEPA
jgi:NADH dehydrogenase/NADH:ubiquinone oxidoreductase subunit G